MLISIVKYIVDRSTHKQRLHRVWIPVRQNGKVWLVTGATRSVRAERRDLVKWLLTRPSIGGKIAGEGKERRNYSPFL